MSEGCADEYFDDANQKAAAAPVVAVGGSNVTADFSLEGGQSPALASITSDPPGAEIFLDYTSTGQFTPALIDVGYVNPASSSLIVASHSLGLASHCLRIASHTIVVQKPGSPRPSPVVVNAIEAETVHHHFDLINTNRGTLQVVSSPAGVPFYVDQVDVPVGVTPLNVTDLLPGSHTVFLDARSVSASYLQPRPIHAQAASASIRLVSVPIPSIPAATGMAVEVSSQTQNAQVYLDYQNSGLTTDTSVNWLDPASHAGLGWRSASHVLQLKKPGYPPSPVFYLCDGVQTQAVDFTLLIDQDLIIDTDSDGLPDDWETDNGMDPGDDGSGDPDNGPNGDKDKDGYTNREELEAGTDPDDANSNLDVASFEPSGPALDTFTFATVPGRRYLVQCNDDLTLSPWVNISGVITATNTTMQFEVGAGGSLTSRYYRALSLP